MEFYLRLIRLYILNTNKRLYVNGKKIGFKIDEQKTKIILYIQHLFVYFLRSYAWEIIQSKIDFLLLNV